MPRLTWKEGKKWRQGIVMGYFKGRRGHPYAVLAVKGEKKPVCIALKRTEWVVDNGDSDNVPL